MPEPPEKFYLTTPIYYVNARPHIGHAYTTIVADVLARRSRAQGTDTFFLTGTDEHGQKIERSAAAAGIPPQHFADRISAQFRTLWDRMGLTYDQFIRTTSPAHKRGVQKLFTTLQQNGHIYLSSYTGAYCVSDETFVDVPTGTPCPDCGRPTETVTEENYFFRLSNFQLPLLNLIESGELQIEPESRRNEVLSFLRGDLQQVVREYWDIKMSSQPRQGVVSGKILSKEDVEESYVDAGLPRTIAGNANVPGALKDLSISRSSFTWGIPVPRDPATAQDHVIYVWLDALANYLTAVGYGDDSPEAQAKFAKYWPADLHIVGKEIIRFHCVYWPAFLLAAGLPLPKKIVAHGWLLFDDSKMSKSKGNIVRTETILEAFGTLCPPPLSLGNPSSSLSVPSSSPDVPSSSLSVPSSSPDDLLSSRSEAEGSASALSTPTPHDRDLFAADVLRYFLLREIPFGQDGSFSFEALITRYNADLANGYGNLVSRTLRMIADFFSSEIPRHDNWPAVTIQVVEKIRTGGRVGGLDPNTFFTIPDNELSRISKACTVFYIKAMDRIKFSQGVDTEGWTRTLSHEEKIDREMLGAIDAIVILIQQTDAYISQHQPWKLVKNRSETSLNELPEILYTAAESIRIITALLHPILPHATANVWRQLGLGDIEAAARNGDLKNLQWGGLPPGTRLGPLSPIFPRIEKKDIPNFIQRMTDMETPTPSLASELVTSLEESKPSFDPAAAPRTSTLPEPNPGAHVAASTALTTERPGTPPHHEAQPSGIFNNVTRAPIADPHPATSGSTSESEAALQITIDDFAKIELRVAQILLAERIPKADKLLRLEVDLGYERRQILSGIAEWYTPEDLLGRRIVVITNLAPRKMRGLESHGMLLAASGPDVEGKPGKPHLATIDSADLPLGARLK